MVVGECIGFLMNISQRASSAQLGDYESVQFRVRSPREPTSPKRYDL